MKKFFIRRTGQQLRPHYPFWMPWGVGGCLWRILLFLLVLAAIIVLLWFLSSLRGCDRSNRPDDGYSNTIELPDSVADNSDSIPGTNLPGNEGERIPDLPGGQIPPPSKLIPDPNDPIHQISANQLMVIIDPEGKVNSQVMDDFKTKFKSIYPGLEYNIPYANPATMMAMLVVPEDERDEIRNTLPSQIADIKFYIDNVEALGPEADRMTPNDPLLNKTWHLDPILAPEGWTITTGTPEIKVAVIDSYFDLSHPDFKGLKIENPVSFTNMTDNVAPPKDANPDLMSHGTHVLGIIAGQMNNSVASTGIAPNVTIMPISLGNNLNSFSVMEAILYATYKGANVINLSLGANFNEDDVRRMTPEQMAEYSKSHGDRGAKMWNYVYDLLDKRNVMAVYASGNSNAYTLLDNSKRADNIIIVDAVGRNLKKTSFSNFANIDNLGIKKSVISAPGEAILSTIPGRRLAEMDGTSMAAPVVTATVALIKSLDPTLANTEIIQLLQETAKPIVDKEIGPLVQIYPALKKIQDNRGKWNDFEKNILGMWKTIEKFPIYTVGSSEWVADCQQYIIFDSIGSGIIELHAIGTDRVWNSRFKAQIRDNEIALKFEPQKDTNGNTYIYDEIRFVPDKNGQIIMRNYLNGENASQGSGYYVKRIKEDDRKNMNKRQI